MRNPNCQSGATTEGRPYTLLKTALKLVDASDFGSGDARIVEGLELLDDLLAVRRLYVVGENLRVALQFLQLGGERLRRQVPGVMRQPFQFIREGDVHEDGFQVPLA